MKEPQRYPNTRWNYIKLFGGTILLVAFLAWLGNSERRAREKCELKHSKEICAHYVH